VRRENDATGKKAQSDDETGERNEEQAHVLAESHEPAVRQ
jgi:hypothetical protein